MSTLTETSPITPLVRELADILRRQGATEVYLFGSRARGDHRPDSDIDLAMRGIPPERYYSTIGRLMDVSPIAVDVIDLDDKGHVMDLIRRTGDFIRVG